MEWTQLGSIFEGVGKIVQPPARSLTPSKPGTCWLENSSRSLSIDTSKLNFPRIHENVQVSVEQHERWWNSKNEYDWTNNREGQQELKNVVILVLIN